MRHLMLVFAIAMAALAQASASVLVLEGTYSGNDDLDLVRGIVGDTALLQLGKCNSGDADACSNDYEPGAVTNGSFFTLTPTDNQSGIFEIVAGSGFTVEYVLFKAGANFVLYEVVPPTTAAVLNYSFGVDLGSQQGLSHVTMFGKPGVDNPIPIPAAALLVAPAVLMVARRRRTR